MLHDPRAVESLKRETMEGWFLDFLPDLNQHDPEVSRYLIQNTLWWIGTTGRRHSHGHVAVRAQLVLA